jgi:hypothetical protein
VKQFPLAELARFRVTMAIVCCFACRSQPTIFISASFVPSLLVGYRKVYSGRREADVVMSSVTPSMHKARDKI